MNHAILKLNNKRAYVLVKHKVYNNVKIDAEKWEVEAVGTDETWHDTNVNFVEEGMTKVGDNFLNGVIVKILSYESYIAEYLDSKSTFEEVDEQTEHLGFIRKVGASRMRTNAYDRWTVEKVLYAVNPEKYTITKLMQADLAD